MPWCTIFFVDDLKLYASSINILKKQLHLVTTFSNDICMKFGQDKCAYIKIEKGKNTTATPIEINGLTIKPVQEHVQERIRKHGVMGVIQTS